MRICRFYARIAMAMAKPSKYDLGQIKMGFAPRNHKREAKTDMTDHSLYHFRYAPVMIDLCTLLRSEIISEEDD